LLLDIGQSLEPLEPVGQRADQVTSFSGTKKGFFLGKTISLIKSGEGGEKNKENILPPLSSICLRCGKGSHQVPVIPYIFLYIYRGQALKNCSVH
jgi:hypothetical protein